MQITIWAEASGVGSCFKIEGVEYQSNVKGALFVGWGSGCILPLESFQVLGSGNVIWREIQEFDTHNYKQNLFS